MRKARKCQICKTREEGYTVQIFGGQPSFYCIGWHMRGWPIKHRVCAECIPTVKQMYAPAAERQERENV